MARQYISKIKIILSLMVYLFYKGTPFLSSITVLNVMVGIVVDAVSEISAAEKMKAMQEKYKDNTSLEKEIDEIKKHLEVMESLIDAQKARN